jgi:trans-aconitate methyltransferase
MPFKEINHVMRLYQSAKIKDRLIILARLLFSMRLIMDVLEQYLPKNGLIIDLGCGYGIIDHLLSFSYPNRKIVGFDVSRIRIESAKKTNSDNVDFQLADIREAQFSVSDAIIIIDIFYLLPYQDQENVLTKCYERLRPNGVMIIKDTDKSASWRFRYTYAEEKIKTKLGIYGKEVKDQSLSGQNELYYRSSDDFAMLLQKIGLDVSIIHKKQFFYPGIFYICRKI